MTATEFSIDSSMFERKHWSLYGEVQYQTTSMVMGIYRARLHHSLGGRFRFTWKVSKDRHRDVCDLYTVRILMQFLSNQPSSPGIINPQKKKKKGQLPYREKQKEAVYFPWGLTALQQPLSRWKIISFHCMFSNNPRIEITWGGETIIQLWTSKILHKL